MCIYFGQTVVDTGMKQCYTNHMEEQLMLIVSVLTALTLFYALAQLA